MYRFILAGLLPALAALPSAAEEPSILTEAEFLSVLDASHPAVTESAAALAMARARVVEASRFDNPVVGLSREDPSGPIEQTDWMLSWQLPGAARGPEIEARHREVEAGAARLAERIRGLRSTMREIYADWALAAAREERLEAEAARVEDLVVRQRARADRGESSLLEVRRLELAAAELRSRTELAGVERARARATATGWFPAMPRDVRPSLPEPPPPPDLGGPHPSVQAAEAELAAVLLDRRASSRFISSPEISLGWQRQQTGLESIDGPLLGISWSVPLLARNQGERARLEARIDAAEAHLERVRREIAAARAGALEVYERLVAAAADAEVALTARESMLEGAEAAFIQGEMSLTDLLDTHRSITEAELAALDLHAAALAAFRELERLSDGTDATENPFTLLDEEPTP